MPKPLPQLLAWLVAGLVIAILVAATCLRPRGAVVAVTAPAPPVKAVPTPNVAAEIPRSALDSARIDDALSFAIEAAKPFAAAGYTLREDYWGGAFKAPGTKPIVHQLFNGNDYWVWLGCDHPGAKISVHVYDSSGHLAEAEAWQKPHVAAAHVIPKKAGTYYLIVEVRGDAFTRPGKDVYWALAYGFR
jgi:hypothetical protein